MPREITVVLPERFKYPDPVVTEHMAYKNQVRVLQWLLTEEQYLRNLERELWREQWKRRSEHIRILIWLWREARWNLSPGSEAM